MLLTTNSWEWMALLMERKCVNCDVSVMCSQWMGKYVGQGERSVNQSGIEVPLF